MKRLVVIAAVIAAAVGLYVQLQDKPAEIALIDATAIPTGDAMFMVGLTVENAGPPDRLVGVSSAAGTMVSIMNPGMMDADLVIPGTSSAIFAMDGAHLMLKGANIAEGAFHPLTLTFEKAGPVATRVRNAAAAPMAHDMTSGVMLNPAPSLTLRPLSEHGADGFEIALDVSNFTFKRVADDAAHVPGEGHAHIYLNGLKLGRAYDPTFRIGALASGSYVLSATLSSHDHRPYLNADGPITSRYRFDVP